MSFYNPYMKKPDWANGIQGIIQNMIQMKMMNRMFPKEGAGAGAGPDPSAPDTAALAGAGANPMGGGGLQGPLSGAGGMLGKLRPDQQEMLMRLLGMMGQGGGPGMGGPGMGMM